MHINAIIHQLSVNISNNSKYHRL